MVRARIKSEINSAAAQLGFDICRFTRAELPQAVSWRLETAIRDGHHGGMDWLAKTSQRRRQPQSMWPRARTAIVMGMNYGPDSDPLETLDLKGQATISVYARNRDYHEVIKGKLKQIAQMIASRTKGEVKVFVDTAPLMEKPLGEQAGLGWQGKHTNLVSRQFGSWLFLGAILTTAEFEPDTPESDHCGNCRSCLDVCPTDAFPAPYRLDARRCISYLTIEHEGPIPPEFRQAMGNRIFGCDDCLAVCPWNKFASQAREAKLVAREDLRAPRLRDLAGLDDAGFRKLFSGSPVKRIGRNRFIRNVLTAIGNSGETGLAAAALPHLADTDPQIRGAAIWALGQLLGGSEIAALHRDNIGYERDAEVIGEWDRIMGECGEAG